MEAGNTMGEIVSTATAEGRSIRKTLVENVLVVEKGDVKIAAEKGLFSVLNVKGIKKSMSSITYQPATIGNLPNQRTTLFQVTSRVKS